jgi:hypothetical protein
MRFHWVLTTNGALMTQLIQTYKNRQQAAEYLKSKGIPCCVATLAGYASRGGSPEFYKFGRKPLYTEEALDKWIESRLSPAKSNTYNTTTKPSAK